MKRNIFLMIVGILLTGTAAQAQFRDSIHSPRGGYDMAYSDEFYSSVLPRYGARRVIENVYRVFFARNMDSSAWIYVRQVEEGNAHEALRAIVSSSEFRYRNMNR